MATLNPAADEASAVSWGAIAAGAACSLAVTLVVVTFAVGAGLSIVSPWAGEGVSSTTAARTAGLMLIAVAMISSTAGGFVAGRLRPSWLGVHEDERYFRDTAHGLTAWALATLITVAVFGSATTKLASGALSGAGSAATITASNAAMNNSAGSSSNIYVDRLLRVNPSPSAAVNAQVSPTATGQTTAPAGGQTTATNPQSGNQNDEATRADFTRVFVAALTPKSQLAPEDRTYLASVVASRSNISQQEAEQRIDQAMTQARQAADTARKAAAKLSFWVAASLLAGALAAMLAATVGGWLRSSTWWDTTVPARTATTVEPVTVTPATRKR